MSTANSVEPVCILYEAVERWVSSKHGKCSLQMGYPRPCVLGVQLEAQFVGLTLVAIALKIWLVQF